MWPHIWNTITYCNKQILHLYKFNVSKASNYILFFKLILFYYESKGLLNCTFLIGCLIVRNTHKCSYTTFFNLLIHFTLLFILLLEDNNIIFIQLIGFLYISIKSLPIKCLLLNDLEQIIFFLVNYSKIILFLHNREKKICANTEDANLLNKL